MLNVARMRRLKNNKKSDRLKSDFAAVAEWQTLWTQTPLSLKDVWVQLPPAAQQLFPIDKTLCFNKNKRMINQINLNNKTKKLLFGKEVNLI